MNCSIHTQTPAAAYCRTCGKPLCDECKRDVRGVIYCEDCIVAGMQHTLPGAAPASGMVAAAAVPASGGPNPTVAGILAGFFPFGLGAVYNGEYGKGLAHMLFFAFIIAAVEHGGGAEPFFGIMMGFFYFYQIFDAVRSARAKQMGHPTPDPLGVYRALGIGGVSGDQTATTAAPSSSAPTGAIILIGIGALFLLKNLDILPFGAFHKLWPLIPIAFGIQMLRRRGQGADTRRPS